MSDSENQGGQPELVAFGKARKGRRKKGGSDGLNVNSMMDIMTILLVFLLVSITSDPLNIKQDKNLRLAKAAGSCGFECSDKDDQGACKKGSPVAAVCRRAYRPPNDTIPITVNKQGIFIGDAGKNVEVARLNCKIGGSPCMPKDIEDKFRCGQLEDDLSKEPCSPDETRRLSKMVLEVQNSYKQGNEASQFMIEDLNKLLSEKGKAFKKRCQEWNEKNSDQQPRSCELATTIIADADIPFRVIAEVIFTAGMAKFTDMRFALLQRQTR